MGDSGDVDYLGRTLVREAEQFLQARTDSSSGSSRRGADEAALLRERLRSEERQTARLQEAEDRRLRLQLSAAARQAELDRRASAEQAELDRQSRDRQDERNRVASDTQSRRAARVRVIQAVILATGGVLAGLLALWPNPKVAAAPIGTGTPIGCVELVNTPSGTVEASGYVFDPDSPDASVPVELREPGAEGAAARVKTTVNRPDIAAAFGAGVAQGFWIAGPVSNPNVAIVAYDVAGQQGQAVLLPRC